LQSLGWLQICFDQSPFRVRDRSTTNFLNRCLSSRQIHTPLFLLPSTNDANGRYDYVAVIKPINIRLDPHDVKLDPGRADHGLEKSNRVLIGSIRSTEFFFSIFLKID
jgi:hypothetical protein